MSHTAFLLMETSLLLLGVSGGNIFFDERVIFLLNFFGRTHGFIGISNFFLFQINNWALLLLFYWRVLYTWKIMSKFGRTDPFSINRRYNKTLVLQNSILISFCMGPIKVKLLVFSILILFYDTRILSKRSRMERIS